MNNSSILGWIQPLIKDSDQIQGLKNKQELHQK